MSREKDRQTNFYINIEKLRNLKITNKESEHRRTKSNHFGSNSFINRDKMHVERRSELLKRYNMGRKHHQSQQQLY